MARRRRNTPLLWMDAPFSVIGQIYQDARRSVTWFHDGNADHAVSNQAWLRRVSVEFQRRLRKAHIYVEGMGQ